MNCKIIAIINQKSKVGKSTIAVNLTYGLSLQNKKVLLIDLDPQCYSSDIYCPVYPSEKNISLAFSGNKKIKLKDLISLGTVQGEVDSNLSIIPSNIRLARTIENIHSKSYKEKILKSHLTQEVLNNFNYIILDCPPSLGILTINAIYCAAYMIIPIISNKSSLDGMNDLLETIELIKKHENYSFFLLKNSYEQSNFSTNKYISDQLKPLSNNVLRTIIRKNKAIKQATVTNLPIRAFNASSKGAQDFNLLTEEIIYYT